jgi:mRNA-degrading endonuclease toxin of MazEF toxin-antitoxin module
LVGKITTVATSKDGAQIGRLDEADVGRVSQAIMEILGLAGARL